MKKLLALALATTQIWLCSLAQNSFHSDPNLAHQETSPDRAPNKSPIENQQTGDNRTFSFALSEVRDDQNTGLDRVQKPLNFVQNILNLSRYLLGFEKNGDTSLIQINKSTYFLSTVYFGGNFDYLPVVWDTGTEWPSVMGFTCQSCKYHATYDYRDELAGTLYVDSYSFREIDFGPAETAGFEAIDWICLVVDDPDSCVKHQQMFIITEQEGIPNQISGVIGLSTGANPDHGPNFIKSLHAVGAISRPVFAFYLRSPDEDGQSFLDVGQIEEAHMSNVDDQVSIDVIRKSDKNWSAYVTGMRFGNQTQQGFGFQAFKAKLDSGSSYVTVPEVYWSWFIENLGSKTTSGLEDYNSSLKKLRHCSDIEFLPSVFVLLGQHYFEIQPQDYVVDYSDYGVGCLLMFSSDSSETMTLGVPFMKGYYIIHDLENVSFTIVPQNGSRKAKGLYSLTPEKQAPRDTMDLMWLWLSLGCIGSIVLGVSVWLIVRYYKKQKNQQKEQATKQSLQEWDWDQGGLISSARVHKGGHEQIPTQQSLIELQAHKIAQKLSEEHISLLYSAFTQVNSIQGQKL